MTSQEQQDVDGEAEVQTQPAAVEPSTADSEIADFLAELEADFGKKPKSKEAAHKQINRDFHAANPQIQKGIGKSPEDNTLSWVPESRITYVVTQHCDCCGDKVTFIGGEYVRFKSKKQHAVITRRADLATNLWHYGWGDNPGDVPDLVDNITQTVHRCAGCIAVEVQAIEIWDQAIKQEAAAKDPKQQEIVLEGLEDLL